MDDIIKDNPCEGCEYEMINCWYDDPCYKCGSGNDYFYYKKEDKDKS